jgi:hypothetical protein
MRSTLAVLLLALAACGPAPAPDTAQEDAFADPVAVALASPPAAGVGTLLGDNGPVTACFAAAAAQTESQCRLSIICDSPTSTLTVRYAYTLAPDQDSVLRVFNTPEQMLDLPARSSSQGGLSVTAELGGLAGAAHAPLVEMLSPQQQRFAVQVGDDITIFPWHDSIARTLAACP